MAWMLPWFIGFAALAWVATLSFMLVSGIPAPIQALSVLTLLAFAREVARQNRQPEEAPDVERIR